MKNVEDLFPLSPLQEGMLFHRLEAPRAHHGLVQLRCDLVGELDPQRFAAAWQLLTQQVPALRTCFLWEGLKQHVQVVKKQATPMIELLDWRAKTDQEKAEQLDQYAENMLATGFDLRKAPLARVALIQIEDDRFCLIVTYEHILFDGWSLSLLNTQLFTAYANLGQGQQPKLQAGRRFRDYVAWVKQQDRQQAATFWRDYLAEANTQLALPFQLYDGRTVASKYTEFSYELDQIQTHKLKQTAREHKVTLNSVIQGLWGILLGFHNETQDVLFGTTVSGRPMQLKGADQMMGLFINTLPARIRFDATVSFWTWVAQLQQEQLEARQFEHSALVDVQQAAQLPAGRALFNSLFVFENYPVADSLSADSLGFSIENSTSFDHTHYPLTLVVSADETLRLKFQYKEALFADHSMQTLAEQLVRMVDALLKNDMPIAQLKSKLGVELIPTSAEKVDFASTITARFEQIAQRFADKIAVQDNLQTLTYAQLRQRAAGLAARLCQDTQPGDLVGLRLERSVDVVVGILAILKAGCTYVPLDPIYPKERMEKILTSSGLNCVLTQATRVDDFGDHNLCVLTVEHVEAADHFEDRHFNPEQAAYVIYTSGSTGAPKGVAVSHLSVMRLFSQTQALFNFNADDVWTLFHSYAFDFSVWEIWGALFYGGRLLVVSQTTAQDTDGFYHLLKSEGVTVLNQTPSAFYPLVQVDAGAATKLNRLRYVIFGGEALEFARLQAWFEKNGEQQPQLVNMYGITETTVHVTHRVVRKSDCLSTRSLIGEPIADLAVHLLDDAGQPVALGIPGEAYVAGAGVSLGYLNRPDLSAERFVFPEGGPLVGQRLYRTGDGMRRFPNGDLEYLGRLDQQVQIRGFRVELEDIARNMQQHPAIDDAVVMLQSVAQAEPILIGYYIGSETLRLPELRNFLGKLLPDYMLPQQVVQLSAFPLTPNGKIDLKALPKPDFDNANTALHHVVPQTPTEALLAEIWAKVLTVDQVGSLDDFFQLGGHSLKATQIASQIKKVFNVVFPLQEVLQYAQLKHQASRIDQLLTGIEAVTPLPLKALGTLKEAPLSYAQERLWFLHHLQPESAAYHINSLMRVGSDLDLAKLQTSLDLVCQRQEILRYTFHARKSQPYRICHVELPVQIVSFKASNEHEWQQFITSLFFKPYDFETGPMLRVAVVENLENQLFMALAMHHIISDGISMEILLREWAHFYQQAMGEALPELTPLTHSYSDFAAWQQKQLSGPHLQQLQDFWRETLTPLPPVLDLATDHPRRLARSGRGGQVRFQIPTNLTTQLTALARKHQATPFMAFLAVVQSFLARYTQQQDFCIGTPISQRNDVALENLIGFFVNTLALRADLTGNPSFETILGRVKQASLAAFAHQALPFEQVVALCDLPKDLNHAPLFQTMFLFETVSVDNTTIAGLDIQPEPVAEISAQFDLTFSFHAVDDAVFGNLIFDADLFEHRTIEAMAGYLTQFMDQLVTAPQKTFQHLPLLTSEQQKVHLRNYGQGQDLEVCEHALAHFEKHADLHGEKLALLDHAESYTYEGLNQTANRLARLLMSKGLKPQQCVGICMERSPRLLVAILATLKVGAYYVPIDPNYPAARQRLMYEDADVALLLLDRVDEFWMQAGSSSLVVDDELICNGLVTYATNNLATTIHNDDIAVVIYTSGSTGKPKGVLVRHNGLAARIDWAQKTWHALDFERMFFATSISFDLSLFEMFVTWSFGGCLCLANNILELPQQAATYQPTFINTVPSAMMTLLDVMQLPESVRIVATAGEAQPDQLYDLVVAQQAHVRVYNLYGPSEDTIYSTAALRQSEEPSHIGFALPGSRCFVLDAWQQLVPEGCVGEICMAGEGLARGYLNRPALTAEKFMPNPFGAKPGERLYRTGDLGRFMPDGRLLCLGRVDHQVKLRGFRIELGEIEAALSILELVAESAVKVFQEPTPQLVAFLVWQNEGVGNVDEIRHQLQRVLPAHMLPDAFVSLLEIPRLPNGKVNRSALERPSMVQSASASNRNATELEAQIAEIFTQVLECDKSTLDLHESFFQLGGQSLLALRLVALVNQIFDIDLAIQSLFEAPNVKDFSAVVNDALASQQGVVNVPLEVIPRDQRLPLSVNQEELWLVDQLQQGNSSFNLTEPLEIKGELDLEALQKAFGDIVLRHEVFQLRYHNEDGRAYASVVEPEAVELGFEDLTEFTAEDQNAAAQKLLQAEKHYHFDLSRDLLMRVRVVRLNRKHHLVMITLHHILCDEWSLRVFEHELFTFYLAHLEQSRPQLPDLPFQYVDFSAWQRKRLEQGALDAQLEYWCHHLLGHQQLRLPLDFERSQAVDHKGLLVKQELELDICKKAEAVAQEQGATLFMFTLAAFYILLYQECQQQDIVIGTNLANRERPEWESLIGMFVNQVALRLQLDPTTSGEQVLADVKSMTLNAYRNKDLPFDTVVKEVAPQRQAGLTPIFQVKVNYRPGDQGSATPDNLDIQSWQSQGMQVHFDLMLSLQETNKGLICSFNGNQGLFHLESLTRFMDSFLFIFKALCDQPSRAVTEICSDLAEFQKAGIAKKQASQKAAKKGRLSQIRRRTVTR